MKNNHKAVHHLTRIKLLYAIIIMLLLILVLRLAYLQLYQYKIYATLALKNQMRLEPIAPTRGVILDRNGLMLAENIPVYVLEVIPERIHNLDKTIEDLKQLLPSLNDNDIETFKHAKMQQHDYVPIPLKVQLSIDEVAIFASNQYLFPGVSIKARLIRHYPFAETAAHILGYVSRISIDELKKLDVNAYKATNFIGKAGIEKHYEKILHGKVGYQQIETDVSGRTLRIISKQAPQSGAKLYLTLDMRLQQTMHQAFGEQRGAAVLMNVNNGEILAMTSSKSFDPNLFVRGISNKDYQALAKDKDKPLYNRITRGLYPPASTVKPFIALEGLDSETINLNSTVYDPGWFRLPHVNHVYHDWFHQGHGTVHTKRAITVSCDTFFYNLSNKMGISHIASILKKFGLGKATGIDLPDEALGVVPDPEWKRKKTGQAWYPGDTLISSIGQGFMLATPLQLANAAATLSTQGKHVRPHLLYKKINSKQQESLVSWQSLETNIKLHNPENWNIVRDAMVDVIRKNEGTGYRFGRNAPYDVAAKTGTAQVFTLSQDENKRRQKVKAELHDHSVFIAYTPVDKPQVALAVLVENDVFAAAFARVILDKYFELYGTKTS
jgi:penicillin-binding protein 2